MSSNPLCVRVCLNSEWEQIYEEFGALINYLWEDLKSTVKDQTSPASSPTAIASSPATLSSSPSLSPQPEPPLPSSLIPQDKCHFKLLNLLSTLPTVYNLELYEQEIIELSNQIEELKDMYNAQLKQSEMYIKLVYDEYCKRKILENKWSMKYNSWLATIEELWKNELPYEVRLKVEKLFEEEEEQRNNIVNIYAKFCEWISDATPHWLDAVHKLEREREQQENERNKAFEAAKAALAEELAHGKQINSLSVAHTSENFTHELNSDNENGDNEESKSLLNIELCLHNSNILDEHGKPRYDVDNFHEYHHQKKNSENNAKHLYETENLDTDTTHSDNSNINYNSINCNNKSNTVSNIEKGNYKETEKHEEQSMSTSALRRKAIELLEKEEAAVRERRAMQLQMIRQQEEELQAKLNNDHEKAMQEEVHKRDADRARRYNELCKEENIIKARIEEAASLQKRHEEERKILLEHITVEEQIIHQRLEERQKARLAEEEAKRCAEAKAKLELYEHLQAEEELLRARQEAREKARQEEKRLEYERVVAEQTNLENKLRERQQAEELAKEQEKIMREAKKQKIQAEKEKQLTFLREQEEEYKLRIRAKEMAELKAREQLRLREQEVLFNSGVHSFSPEVTTSQPIMSSIMHYPQTEYHPLVQTAEPSYLEPVLPVNTPLPLTMSAPQLYRSAESLHTPPIQSTFSSTTPAVCTSSALLSPSAPVWSAAPSLPSTSSVYVPNSNVIYQAHGQHTPGRTTTNIMSIPTPLVYSQPYVQNSVFTTQYRRL